ncbi:Ger(x)C family spore germination protein [Alteribacter natronophilus]|uniref:Ger(x)C family spore germination protein n=1 Tax=Alteribacter natronophilus TaxID=2583810 RepID=UPI00110F3726|nr:Ger(x)C family spore germination protein [Alteribacter natronophilus]TMW72774.1 Ger(x)C family spore germination protein [Alteribacter natronophilus]
MKKICLLILAAVLLGGCWDERPLEEMALITVITLDYDEETDSLILAASYPEFSTQAADDQEVIIANKARSTAEALYLLNGLTDKVIVEGEVQVMFVGEEMARKGLYPVLDTLQRNVEVSSNLYICVIEGKANELLTTAFEDKPLDGFYMARLIKKQEQINELPATSLNDFHSDYLSRHTDPILPFIKLKEKEIEASRTAVFVDDSYTTHVGTDETQLLVMLRNDGTSSQFTMNIDNDKKEFATIAFVTSHTDVDVHYEEGELGFDVMLDMKAKLIEYEGEEEIHSPEAFEELSSQFQNHLQQIAEDVVLSMQQEYGADPIGLGEYARPHFKKEISMEEWRSIFQDSQINLTVDLTITQDGDFR